MYNMHVIHTKVFPLFRPSPLRLKIVYQSTFVKHYIQLREFHLRIRILCVASRTVGSGRTTDGSKMVEIQPIPGGTATGKPAFHIDSRTRRIAGNRKFAARSRSCDNRTNSIVFAALATLRSGPIRSWRTGKSVSMTRRCDGGRISRPIGSFSIVEGVERRMSSIEDETEEEGGIASTAYITSHIYSKLYTANSSATSRQRNIHCYEHPLPLTIRFTLDRWKFILTFLTICWKTPRATFGRIRRFEENLF